MKRTSMVLGILGLVCAMAMPAASAAVCLQTDFDGDKFEGVGGVYMQGVSNLQREDPGNPPFLVEGGFLRSSPEGNTVGSDGVTGENDPAGVRHLLLTGDPAWTDVTITAKIFIDSQNTGGVALVARAAPKTKVEDPDTWYEFRYTTGNSVAPADEQETSGIPQPDTNPNLRIMKVVNGRWTILAESTAAQEASIPAINAAGDDNETGATFRFRVTGNLLEGFVSRDGTNFEKYLEARDDDLKAGRIGISHYDYSPLIDNLIVECP
jgi:hypothetical protein